MMTTLQRRLDDYITIRTISIYRPFLELLTRLAHERVLHIVVSRWSKGGDDEGSAEQASKTLALHRHAVPAVQRALDTIPNDAWLSDEGRAAYGIVPCECVM